MFILQKACRPQPGTKKGPWCQQQSETYGERQLLFVYFEKWTWTFLFVNSPRPPPFTYIHTLRRGGGPYALNSTPRHAKPLLGMSLRMRVVLDLTVIRGAAAKLCAQVTPRHHTTEPLSKKQYSRFQLRWFPRHRSAVLQGGQQVSSTILMYTAKRGREIILVAIESTLCIQMYAWNPWTRLNRPEVLLSNVSPQTLWGFISAGRKQRTGHNLHILCNTTLTLTTSVN